MKAYVFPGQASQFPGMGQDLYDTYPTAKELMEQANDILGFRLTDVMFKGSNEDLRQTEVTQPSVFLYAVTKANIQKESLDLGVVAGHSLGEFSALVVAGALSFEDGLSLVKKRALAMQSACEQNPGTMAAIVGLDDEVIESICDQAESTVVAANYNCPGQLVISGSIEGIDEACAKCEEAGARRVVKLPVGGAFHSPLMEPARAELAQAIEIAQFSNPICPIYQNVDALAHTDSDVIKTNLNAQLTAPVRWTATMQHMIQDGVAAFVEVGGTVLSSFVKRVDRKIPTTTL